MALIDKEYTAHPFYGRRQMTAYLRRQGYTVNPKRVRRLMQKMSIAAIYPKPRTTVSNQAHRIYPYLLRGVEITGCPLGANQVWSSDITYIPMPNGFIYLTAIMDWYSRYVLAWQRSNTLDPLFCLDALEHALCLARPEIFNTDQVTQFTATTFTARLEAVGVRISMDGKGRALDNIFVERLWRTVKYEDIYLKHDTTVPQLYTGLHDYFGFYNYERPHQGLDARPPAAVYQAVT